MNSRARLRAVAAWPAGRSAPGGREAGVVVGRVVSVRGYAVGAEVGWPSKSVPSQVVAAARGARGRGRER